MFHMIGAPLENSKEISSPNAQQMDLPHSCSAKGRRQTQRPITNSTTKSIYSTRTSLGRKIIGIWDQIGNSKPNLYKYLKGRGVLIGRSVSNYIYKSFAGILRDILYDLVDSNIMCFFCEEYILKKIEMINYYDFNKIL